MHLTRTTRRAAAALLAATLLLGTGTAVAKDGDDKADQRAHQALEQARKHHRTTPAITEVRGSVATVAPATRTFELNVTDGNQPTLKGKKVTVKLAPEAYLTLNDKKTTIADIKVGDSARVTGLLDAASGPITAYLVRFGRTAPAPTQVKGTVASVSTTGFSLTVGTSTVALVLGTPSIVTLNGQAATLADIHVGDKGEATVVSGVAYVARFTRALPPTPGPTRVEGTVTSISPLTLFAAGLSVPIQMATPSLVSVADAPATIADVHIGDRCTAIGIANPAGGLVAYLLACRRP